MKNENLIAQIEKAHKTHLNVKAKLAGERKINDNEYRKDVEILAVCVKEGQDIELVRAKVIMRHQTEMEKYDGLIEAFETGNVKEALKGYFAVSDNFDELYKDLRTEEKNLEEMMRDASYMND
jgi:hypothetical protein